MRKSSTLSLLSLPEPNQRRPKMAATLIPLLNRLITTRAKQGRLHEARRIFDQMPQKNVFSWNAIISAYVINNDLPAAYVIFSAAPKLDAVTFNTLISAYVTHDLPLEATKIFLQMQRSAAASPDNFTFPLMIKTAAAMKDIAFLRQLNAAAVKGGAIIELSTWNAVISRWVKKGHPDLALQLFQEVGLGQSTILINGRALVSVISACSSLKRIEQGRQAHVKAIKDRDLSCNPYVGATVVDFYCLCGELTSAARAHVNCAANPFAMSSMVGALVKDGRVNEARVLYESTPEAKSLPALTVLVSGYLWGGESVQAQQLLLSEMSTSALASNLDEGFFVRLIVDSAELAELRRGKELHGLLLRQGLQVEGKIAAGLVDMYSKCGDIVAAGKVFTGVSVKDLVLCNVMLTGLARHGRGLEALQLFEKMVAGDGLPAPAKATYLAAISACVHAGLVAAGERLFSKMGSHSPEPEHYSCMVDLYARAGMTEKAVDVVVNMPVQPDAATWGVVLRGGAAAVKKMVAKEVLEMSGGDGARYVQVANAFAEDGDWLEVEKVRNRMRSSRARRIESSCSRVDGGGATVFFGSGGSAALPVLEILIFLHNEMMTHEDIG